MPLCSNCGQEPALAARHGYGNACYQRWRKAGKPESGPPPRQHDPPTAEHRAALNAALAAAHEERLARFRCLDRDKTITDAEIAAYMGVNIRTVTRYRAAERAAGRGWRKPPVGPRSGRRS